jgi:hemerythrin-like domain-containing protein
MSGPMSMYLYIHGAILSEVADIEAVAKELKWDDPSEVDALGTRLDWFHELARKHESSEEAVLFPALNERMAFVAETYEFDHDDFESHVFQGITQARSGLAKASATSELRSHGEHLYRESVALHEHMRLHIAKENELLLPHLEAEFDIAEQAQIAGAMAGMFDPSDMAEVANFTYRWQTAADREAMLRFMHSMLPPPAFEGLSGYLKSHNAEAWEDTERRLADLVS